MDSIVHSTQQINQLGTTKIQRSESIIEEDEPLDTMTISDIRQILYSQQHIFSLLNQSKEYHLCYALAALLCNIYQILEYISNNTEQENDFINKEHDDNDNNNNNVYQRLREKVSFFRNHDIVTIATTEDEFIDLWYEMDQLLNVVYCLGYEKWDAPPAYHTRDEEEEEEEEELSPPPYISEKKQLDLDQLFSTLDRLSQAAPQLNNQRVDITERQANELTAASIGKIIDRLSSSRMNNQRATLPTITTNLKQPNKDIILDDLIFQVCHTTLKSFNNQRDSLDSRLQRKVNHVTIHGLLDRLDRGRMVDQEWKPSSAERLSKEMSTMMDHVVKSSYRPRFSKQRFQMTNTKERHMYMSDLLYKVNKSEERRMENQDAFIRPNNIKEEEEEEEIFDLFDHMAKLQLSNQRAVYKGPNTLTSKTITTTTTTTCLA
ncbi:hypothetical protein INT45_011497 [Circinella minor]|uniref:Uncharacterized protein n=1 Tax=Circinella minor TaxID=1195481 RepID=A0A8H7VL43_9FUNG|nr:hypothetical protein INT45_011497 [Circinella minor]